MPGITAGLPKQRKILVTGSRGLLGGLIVKELLRDSARNDVYGLARRMQTSARVCGGEGVDLPPEKLFIDDLSNLEATAACLRGMDIVVHMAADPSPDIGWHSLLPSNIVGAYHLFEGAKRAGVQRIVFASSLCVNFALREIEPYKSFIAGGPNAPESVPLITHGMPVRPLDLYGCSKVWGEALARMYSEGNGMSCICLRMGWVLADDRVPDLRYIDTFCSRRDVLDAVMRSIDAPMEIRFDIFYAVSANRKRWVSVEHGRNVLGYEPKDCAEEIHGVR